MIVSAFAFLAVLSGVWVAGMMVRFAVMPERSTRRTEVAIDATAGMDWHEFNPDNPGRESLHEKVYGLSAAARACGDEGTAAGNEYYVFSGETESHALARRIGDWLDES